MIYLVAREKTPRLQYLVRLLQDCLWQHPCQLITYPQFDAGQHHPAVNYTGSPLADTLAVPVSGLLQEQGWARGTPPVTGGQLPRLFPGSSPGEGLDYDALGAIFYLASGYEAWHEARYDRFGRYDWSTFPSQAWGLDQQPLAHRYAGQLWEGLRQQPGGRQLPARPPLQPRVEFTVDVDFPWRYRHKPAWVQAAGWLRAGLRRDRAELRDRWQAWRWGTDPHDTFDQLFQLLPPAQTTFFFLLERRTPYDSRFTWRLPALRGLIRDIQEQGYRLGMHPSFGTMEDPPALEAEVDRLRALTGEAVTHSRQHFLRYRLPQTFRALLAAGIRHEYSLCRGHEGGFPWGMAVPFPWYDLAAETETALWLHPTLLMDRSLLSYRQLSPEAAITAADSLWQTTREVGGTFTLLLHNEVLSEGGEWAGWSAVAREWVTKLLAEG